MAGAYQVRPQVVPRLLRRGPKRAHQLLGHIPRRDGPCIGPVRLPAVAARGGIDAGGLCARRSDRALLSRPVGERIEPEVVHRILVGAAAVLIVRYVGKIAGQGLGCVRPGRVRVGVVALPGDVLDPHRMS